MIRERVPWLAARSGGVSAVVEESRATAGRSAQNAPLGSSVHRKRTACRACGSTDQLLFLSLGPMPMANAFLLSPEEFDEEPFFPLDVYFCGSCSLVQLFDVIDPSVLFRNYIYTTGTAETIASHNREYARMVVEDLGIGSDDLVVEVASNDGSLLSCFQAHQVRTLGVEPAMNIAAMAQDRGIETLNEFFSLRVAKSVREKYGPAKAVIGNNVLAHVDETQDFLRGCAELLTDDGRVIIEVPYLAELLARREYDTIYHEHLCYFSVTALMRLCDEVELSIVRMDRVSVHGGSLRMYAAPKRTHPGHADAVQALAARERALGLTSFGRYAAFAAEVDRNRHAVREFLERAAASGKTVGAYGAPAKGNTLLNYCGIDSTLIPFTVDRNPRKVGTYTPGSHIPVLPVEELLERQPDYTMILAWNFADEVVRQQSAYADRGGQFVVPIPEPQFVAEQ
jgi:hypothetical protein